MPPIIDECHEEDKLYSLFIYAENRRQNEPLNAI